MELTLTNIRTNLNKAFKMLEDQLKIGHSGKAILAVGNTGCGKSTLLSAIIMGPDKLQEERIMYPFKKKGKIVLNKNGEPLMKKGPPVIAYKDKDN